MTKTKQIKSVMDDKIDNFADRLVDICVNKLWEDNMDIPDVLDMQVQVSREIRDALPELWDWVSLQEENRQLKEKLKIPNPARDIANEFNVLLAAKDKENSDLRLRLALMSSKNIDNLRKAYKSQG